MSKKQISTIIGAVITVAGALGIGGYSLSSEPNIDVEKEQIKSLTERVTRIENAVIENGKGISKIIGYLRI